MNLNEVNVLVDGYNLEMQKGTGIKTYSTTLIQSLVSLGANVDLLCSRYIDTDNALLAESMFFDVQNSSSRQNSKLKLLKLVIKQYLFNVNEIPNQANGFVIRNESDSCFDYLTEAGKIFNSSECFLLANNLYKLLGVNTSVKIDKKIDIWHMTYPLPIKIKNAKMITTIHDLVPLKLPYTTLDDKKFFFNIVDNAIKNSDLILTVSQSARQDILQRFEVNPEKVILTYQPLIDKSNLLEESSIDFVLKKYLLKPQKYILFVGAIEPKKNVGRLIDAYRALDNDMNLVIVGKKAWSWEGELANIEGIFGENSHGRVKIIDYLPRRDLNYLYKGAFCFVFPSLYEGFGLPPLEAMSFGCPVIVSKVSSLPEVCGNAAIYIDPYDSDDIRKGIEKLINNPQIREKLIELGKERVKLFSMKNYAEKLSGAYAKMI